MTTDYVELNGTGSASGVPDLAVLRLRVEHGAATVGEALGGCAESARAVVVAMDAAGIAPADRQTTRLALDTRWNAETGGPDGYLGAQAVTVLIREPTRIGAVIEAAAAAAGDDFRLDGLTWAFSDLARLQARAREAAWADARARAEQVSGLAGRPLGEPIRVRESAEAGFAARSLKADLAPASSPVEAGETAVSVTLLVRWAFAPAG